MYEEDRIATPADACREYAYAVGGDHPSSPYILTDYDTFERNPFFTGPRCWYKLDPEGRDYDEWEAHANCERENCTAPRWHGPVYDAWQAGRGELTAAEFATDDLPF